jgi:hypothetical protein
MSTTTTDFAALFAGAQKQAIASIKQAQDVSLKAARVAVGLVPGDGPALPAFPAPRAIVESSFGFVGEVLNLQRAYALELADIVAEGAGKLGKTSAETARK